MQLFFTSKVKIKDAITVLPIFFLIFINFVLDFGEQRAVGHDKEDRDQVRQRKGINNIIWILS